MTCATIARRHWGVGMGGGRGCARHMLAGSDAAWRFSPVRAVRGGRGRAFVKGGERRVGGVCRQPRARMHKLPAGPHSVHGKARPRASEERVSGRQEGQCIAGEGRDGRGAECSAVGRAVASRCARSDETFETRERAGSGSAARVVSSLSLSVRSVWCVVRCSPNSLQNPKEKRPYTQYQLSR